MIPPANHVSGPKQGQWTYNSYAKLPDDGRRYEVMNGVLIMAPAPSGAHQDAVFRIAQHLFNTIEACGLGKMYLAPFDVELTPSRVVQPDVLVVLTANRHKLTASHMIGAPDLVVEVASPATAIYDRLSKYEAYEQAGVSEYWIAHPEEHTIEVLVLNHGTYESLGTFQGDEHLQSRVAPDIAAIPVYQFFA
jgi:Uma2 family endonuclease